MHADGTCVAARAHGRPFLFRLGAPGRHLAMNALGVLAAVEALGGDIARAALALGAVEGAGGRGARAGRVLLGPAGLDGAILLIDESYNANPAAMAAALEVFAGERPTDGLGKVVARAAGRLSRRHARARAGERELHAGLATVPALASVTTVHCAGERMRALFEALPPAQRGEWFPDAGAMAARAGRLLDAGDIAMVKGSLGSRVGQVVEAIKGMGEARPAEAPEGTP